MNAKTWLPILGIIGCFLGGCAVGLPEGLPAAAMMSASGNNKLVWTAPHDGMIFVYDTAERRMVYSGNINRGDVLAVDPDQDNIMLGSMVVTERNIGRGHEHQIYFNSSERRGLRNHEM